MRNLRSPIRSVSSVTSSGGVLCYCPLSITRMTGKYKKSRTEQNFDDLILIDVQGIYKIINKNNGKYYVGSSVDIKERWNEHRRNLL